MSDGKIQQLERDWSLTPADEGLRHTLSQTYLRQGLLPRKSVCEKLLDFADTPGNLATRMLDAYPEFAYKGVTWGASTGPYFDSFESHTPSNQGRLPSILEVLTLLEASYKIGAQMPLTHIAQEVMAPNRLELVGDIAKIINATPPDPIFTTFYLNAHHHLRFNDLFDDYATQGAAFDDLTNELLVTLSESTKLSAGELFIMAQDGTKNFRFEDIQSPQKSARYFAGNDLELLTPTIRNTVFSFLLPDSKLQEYSTFAIGSHKQNGKTAPLIESTYVSYHTRKVKDRWPRK